MNMTQLIEAAQAQRRAKGAESVARSTRDAEIVEASKAADLADLRAMLGEEMADEMEIALFSHDVNWDGQYSTRYRLKPRAWNGLVSFDIYRLGKGKPWRLIYEDQYLRDDYVEVGVEPGQMWARPRALNMLAALQEQYEKERDGRIAVALEWLGGNTSELTADDAREILMTLAPERAAEWDAARAAWQARREKREEDMDAYAQALTAWRRQYEKTLAENRATVAEAQRVLNVEFTRYEVAYAAVGDADDEPYRETAWAAQPAPDPDGYWKLYEGGRIVRRWLLRPMWVGEAVTETLTAAGNGPWRNSVYVTEVGDSLFCLPGEVAAVRRDMVALMKPLPAEPEPPEWVRDGLTAAERERIVEVTRGMAHVDIPF